MQRARFPFWVGLVLVTGCGLIDLNSVTDTPTVTDQTRLPESDPSLVSTTVAADRVTYMFSAPPKVDLQAGDVIVGQQDGGYLRQVASVQASGNTLVVMTQNAALTDAFSNLQVPYEIDPAQPSHVAPLLDLSGRVLLDTKVQGVPVKVTVVSGTVTLDPKIDIDLNIEKQSVKHLGLTAKGTLTLDLQVKLEIGGVVTFQQEVDLSGPNASLVTYPFTFFIPTFIGPLPVTGTLDLDAFAGFDATVTAKGSLTTGLKATSELQLGAVYDKGAWTVQDLPTFDETPYPPQVDTLLASDLRAYVRPEVRLTLYKVAGPKASITPSLKANITATPTPSVALDGCLSGELGFDVSIFGHTLLNLVHDFPESCRPL